MKSRRCKSNSVSVCSVLKVIFKSLVVVGLILVFGSVGKLDFASESGQDVNYLLQFALIAFGMLISAVSVLAVKFLNSIKRSNAYER